MGKRNTAIKGCLHCKKLVPTATRYCRCGYDFKKPNLKTNSRASTSAPTPPPGPKPKPEPAPAKTRRKPDRRQRITVKPVVNSSSDYENPFKKVCWRTASDTNIGDDVVNRKRGRPRKSPTGLVKTSISKPTLSQAAAVAKRATDSPGTTADSKDSKGSKRKRVQEQIDMYASLPTEKQLQYKFLLMEVNRKFFGQVFRPT